MPNSITAETDDLEFLDAGLDMDVDPEPDSAPPAQPRDLRQTRRHLEALREQRELEGLLADPWNVEPHRRARRRRKPATRLDS